MKAVELRVGADDRLGIGDGAPADGQPVPEIRIEFPASEDGGQALRELVRRLLERNHQLETALRSRIVIEQAKGVLAERHVLDPDDAFEVLRKAARSQRMKIHALAAEVVGARETPPAIREVLAAR